VTALKLTLISPSSRTGIDIEVDAPSDITVGALAAELAARSPHHHGPAASMALVRNGYATPVDPNAGAHESGIASGATVELIEDHVGFELPSEPSAGVAVVISGPDAGRSFPLRGGSNVIGRDPACEIVLSDQMASRRHARIEVTGPVHVVDLGSVNGTIVAGAQVEKARVEPTTDILIGDTTLRVHSHRELAAAAADAFVRSPPGHVPFVAVELTAPSVPTKAKAGRIPVIAAVAPLVLGGVMFVMTRRPESLIFVALSPLMLMGNAVEARLSNRSGAKRGTEEFRKKLAEFETTGRERLATEALARRNEHPDLPELIGALRDRTPTLWSRRPDADHFAEICVGRAPQPPRTTFTAKLISDGQEVLTAELDTVLDSLSEVVDVPVVIDLQTDGSVGVAGPPYHARSAVSSMIASLALLHSPAELSIGLMTSEATEPQWDWLKWLPHADTRYSPFEAQHLASSTAACLALHGSLTELRESRPRTAGGQKRSTHVPVVVLVIEDDAPIERPLLIELLERGPEAGIHMIWVATAIDRLPAGCGAVLDLLEGPRSISLRVRRTKQTTVGIRCTVLEPDELDDVARSLSPIVDVGARTRGDSGLPDVVFGPHLLGLPPTAAPEMVLERWSQTSIEAARQVDTGLRAAVGIAAGEPLVLDLRTHGPHALVGGTTGAGKSEFLQAWVMGLASSYSPQRVNFLFVDYKGGSAFSECVKLPHCVGLVTDLSPHLVDRALTSLHAELQRREHLFGALDAKDIHELERRGAAETPPALIIVIDEFAALAQEVPDFVTGVVNVAQRGRSLGLHLILATQRPAGVITGNLRANTNLRVALRMADESDSSDVIDAKDAAFIDAAHPGRGFAKVGPGRTHAFQSAYYGGWSTRASAERKVAVRELSIGGGEPWEVRRAKSGVLDEPNDLAQLVASMQRAALVGQHANPRRPWLSELPAGLDLRQATLTRSDGEIVFGTRDVPAEQAQPPISFFPDRDGNLAVYGASGTGKSTLLRTIAMVAGSSVERPDSPDGPCHVYCIDFGSRSLQLLEDFPHVGSVIGADDHERIDRLVRELRSTINERQISFRAADADSIAQYREATGESGVPRILVLIDNFGAFRQAYDTPDRAATLEHLTAIMADGRSVGVHVVLSADRPGTVPSAITSLVPRRLVLRLANDSDYMLVGERTDVLDGAVPPGRGLEDGCEFQVAVLGGTGNLAEQTRLARALARHDGFISAGHEAPPVRQLPTLVRLAELPPAIDGRPVLGLDDVTLSPIGFVPSGAFLVAGPPGSGRSTAMGTIAVSLGRSQPTFQRVLFAERRSTLTGLARWTTVAERPAEYAELAAAIAADLKQAEGPLAGLAIFIENAPELLEGGEPEAPLLDLMKTALAHDAFVVVEGESSLLARAWKLDPIKTQRTGLLLQPQVADGDLLKVTLPRGNPDRFPVGRGMLIARRDVAKVQVAVPGNESA
jgi:S-DNA-T family DNA segregation ATPase FtsK/SpoIIIE